ncbi:hypothetical protein ACWDBF_21080 [Streptomyces angustmyceticus]
MPRPLTPAERLAAADKDNTLEQIVAASTWDRFLVEQAVFAVGLANDTFSANLLRDLLPEMGHGYIGAAINSLRTAGIIEHTGQVVPSTSPATHGHRLGVWRLSVKGLVIAEARRPRKAAA